MPLKKNRISVNLEPNYKKVTHFWKVQYMLIYPIVETHFIKLMKKDVDAQVHLFEFRKSGRIVL